jgi:hypothetical protein
MANAFHCAKGKSLSLYILPLQFDGGIRVPEAMLNELSSDSARPRPMARIRETLGTVSSPKDTLACLTNSGHGSRFRVVVSCVWPSGQLLRTALEHNGWTCPTSLCCGFRPFMVLLLCPYC